MDKFYNLLKTKLHTLHTLDALYTLIFYLSILIFIIGFGFRDTPTPFGWYQQFMPNLNGRQIVDITFTDSLTGYAITNRLSTTDTSFIMKTTNSGDGWSFVYGETTNSIFKRIEFINQNTGFVGGLINFNYILKTTNKGVSWFYIYAPYNIAAQDMGVLNEDTIWIVDPESLTGGVYRTTNGGINWEHQASFASNPDHIYMFNSRIGFISQSNSYTRKTTDGGQNWFIVTSGGGEGFYDLFFIDSLTGWGAFVNMRKTTDGGLNWIQQSLPQGGNIISSGITQFSNINRDTIWGTGGIYNTPNGFRGMVYRTTNGGTNWLFQVPDTSIHLWPYDFCKFINNNNGWVYKIYNTGIHTKTGGDTTFLTGIRYNNYDIPRRFLLYQNYPNPFNPITKIKYSMRSNVKGEKSNIKIVIYNITGQEISTLINKMQAAGEHEVTFDGSGYSSGVYFYSLYMDGALIDTKKMILLK